MKLHSFRAVQFVFTISDLIEVGLYEYDCFNSIRSRTCCLLGFRNPNPAIGGARFGQFGITEQYVSCCKCSVQFGASFVTLLMFASFDEVCRMAVSFVFFFIISAALVSP